jgi:hypothetical protein
METVVAATFGRRLSLVNVLRIRTALRQPAKDVPLVIARLRADAAHTTARQGKSLPILAQRRWIHTLLSVMPIAASPSAL